MSVELLIHLDAIAQLDEDHMNSFAYILCQGFSNAVTEELLGASFPQLKTLAIKLSKLGLTLAKITDILEQEAAQPVKPLLPPLPAESTSKNQ